MRLGVLGGTFDPIHNGHLSLARAARRTLGLDKVIFVPAGDPPHKHQHSLAEARHRAAMVDLAIADSPGFELSRIDLDRPGPHFSVDMLALLHAEFSVAADDCFFIIGADSLVDLPDWYAPDRLLSLCRLAVAHRPGYYPNLPDLASRLPLLETHVFWVEMPNIPISATNLRKQIADAAAVGTQLPASVAQYIQQNGLYRHPVSKTEKRRLHC